MTAKIAPLSTFPFIFTPRQPASRKQRSKNYALVGRSHRGALCAFKYRALQRRVAMSLDLTRNEIQYNLTVIDIIVSERK